MSAIRAYLISVVSAGLLVSVVLSLVTKPPVRRIVKLCCGCFLALVVLSALYQADLTDVMSYFSQFGEMARNRAEQATEKNEKLLEDLIRAQTEQRISDKAAELGVCVTVSAELKYDDTLGYDVPYAVSVSTNCGADAKAALQSYIETQLIIPKERQNWVVQ